VRRLVLSPRWILWHLLTLAAVASCLWLAGWQWGRAGSAMGSALNVGYGLQWPLFAIFFAVMWWRFLRMELADLEADPRSADSRKADPGKAGPAVAGGDDPASKRSTSAPQFAPVRAPVHGPNPFGPRPATAQPAAIEEDSALAAYNRMLANLAERHPEN
jgi:hypothetical protein